MRLDGVIPWEALDDPTRPTCTVSEWESAREFIQNQIEYLFWGYTRNYLQSQDHYFEVLVEKNTVFPAHYTFFTKVFIWVFLILLGLSLPGHEDVGYFSVPAVFVIGWVFFLVDGIGDYMQDPFEENRNSTPVSSIARTLEINLKELLGEDELPEPLRPVEGALW